MLSKLGQHLQYDPTKLRLTRTFPNGNPKCIHKCSTSDDISDLIKHNPHSSPVLFYEKLDGSDAK